MGKGIPERKEILSGLVKGAMEGRRGRYGEKVEGQG
jgi:hypothetical protein